MIYSSMDNVLLSEFRQRDNLNLSMRKAIQKVVV